MKQIILGILSFMLMTVVSAQTIKKYSGQMSKPKWIEELFEDADPYDTKGFYSYYEDANENRIINGDFMISYKTGVLDGVDRYEIKGSFSHGKRDGKWEMKAKLLNGKYAQNYLYQFNYKDGVLNGPFHFYSSETENVEIIGQFANGVISGKVIIKQHCWIGKCYTQVEGQVNDKGNPHGIWTEKDVSEKAIPKEVTRLYYDGNLVYRREKDLSSGDIAYTYSFSDEIRVPADTVKITDTIIKGQEYLKVGAMICGKNTNIESYEVEARFVDDRGGVDKCVLYGVVHGNCPMMEKVYPSIENWRTKFDSEYYRRKQAEEQRKIEEQLKEEKRLREKQLREERRLREEAERRQREEEWRIKREEEEKIRAAYEMNSKYYDFCWGPNARYDFEKLYREIGVDSIEVMLDSISRYEYENYTVEELFSKQGMYHDIINWGTTRNKKLKKVFKTYEEYLQCKKGGTLNSAIEQYRRNRNPIIEIIGF